MKMYNVFYINLLQKALIDPLISQINNQIPLVITNKKKE